MAVSLTAYDIISVRVCSVTLKTGLELIQDH